MTESLGTGGMGRVFRASDETLGREVALKILDTSMEDSAARLRAEAAALARVSHPGIATVYELIELEGDDHLLVMAMELVRGQTLQHLLEQAGVFSPRRAAELCIQALAALEEAHAAGVVHRDLKPANLMLTERGSIKVMDFGIARLNGSVNLTHAGSMLGTPAYMAPEQVLGQAVDARTDVYAMGIVFFRLITAALPFKGETPFQMAQAQVNDAPATATEVRAGLPPWVDDIVARALAKKPDDRFQSAVEFRETLARVIADAHEPHVAAAVETTEVMPLPAEAPSQDASEPVEMAEAVGPNDRDARPVVINGWIVIAASVLIAGTIWLFNPFGASSPDAAETQTLTSVDTAPASGSVGEPPAVEDPAAGAKAKAANGAATTAADASSGRGSASKSTPAPENLSNGAARPAASFKNVKFLAVNGSRTAASDVVVELSDDNVILQSQGSTTAQAVLPYRGITKATYVRGKDPQWDPALSGPSGKIDVPGILGRARHWLVLQGPDGYLILRLDGEDRLDVMKTFEERAGIAIDRKN